MEPILHTSRFYLLQLRHNIKASLWGFLYFAFPFLSYPEELAQFRIDYSNTHDYLFLPEKMSTKKYMYPETISLGIVLLLLLILFVFALMQVFTAPLVVVISGLIAFTYVVFNTFKLYVVYQSFAHSFIDFTKEEIDAVTDEELPVYTIYLALKYEAEVIDQVIAAVEAIDYPREKLNIVVPLEPYDTDTIKALEEKNLPSYYQLKIMPIIHPQMKPKSMNFGLPFCHGEFFVVYDAEIIPDPDQLKKAYLAFRKHDDIASLQVRLDHYNAEQNILTALFNIEFSFYYDYFLPGLQKLGFPIPLSGHSTHFRLDVIRDMGGWDSYNATEDCEIGMRLYRRGYKTGVLNSTSKEEAASSIGSWIKQRTRWSKGFIQTSMVHLRHPFHFKTELGGWKNLFAFILTVPGTIALNFLNLISWFVLMVWLVTSAEFIQEWYPLPILYLATTSFVVGSFVFMYLNLLSAYRRNKFNLIKYGLLTPFYWMLLAVASTRALAQIIFTPTQHYWEKTTHGTHLQK